jgi:outer membrane protein OmpA-like peptidoglycan-associated protein
MQTILYQTKLLIMKNALFIVSLFFVNMVFGQKIVKDHYTVSGGLLGAVNFSTMRIGGENPSNFAYASKNGFDGGIWVNFPLGKILSIEPQAYYSSNRYAPLSNSASSFDGSIDYIALPLLLKVHLGSRVAITAGPQFNFQASVNDHNGNVTSSDLSSVNTAITGGLEIMPHARLTLFGRYIYGMTDLNKESTSGTEVYTKGYQVGLKLRLFGKHILADSDGDGINDVDDKCPSQVGLARYKGCPIPDTDADGINDEEDKCPSVAGLAKYQGCPIPDTDKDGVNDEQDKCPTVAGLAKYQGCPIPDTDGDGINDEEDKCPSVAGLAKYQGCPIPDTDGDGINDEQDRCPNVAGIPENLGCPDLKFYYKRDVAALDPADKLSLDKVVDFMNRNPDINLIVEGHTSTLGATKYNKTLSDKRAGNCVKYLVSKGIGANRLKAIGYGEEFPIGDNSKEEGRALSRRVVFKIDK